MNKAASTPKTSSEEPDVDLKDPAWAALLAWLLPGAGHFYQRRFGKGALFAICILGTYFYGLALGDGHVVYAAWRDNDHRWQYFCQMGVGLPAMPAIIQAIKVRQGGDPFFVTREFDPKDFPEMEGVEGPLKEGFMAPPPGPIFSNDNDVLGVWHDELRHLFEIGTLYTVVAGLLNILAIYDAYAGPTSWHEESDDEEGEDEDTE